MATDDERLARHVKDFGGEVMMTAAGHPSGTDRCAEVVAKLDGSYQYVINIQGDEPFIDPGQIDTLADVLRDGSTEIATLIIRVDNKDVLFDTGEVKVVMTSEMGSVVLQPPR